MPNPSFEDTISCPTAANQLTRANGWINPTLASPDYFNSCNNGNYSIPLNVYGNESAHSGEAYAGIINIVGGGIFREYLQTQLINPLEANQTYCVSFYVSLSDSSPYAVNNIGVYFSNVQISGAFNSVMPYVPQAYNHSNKLTIKNGWRQVVDTITAQGGEEYITLGCFTNDANTDTTYLGGPPFWAESYHFIDDISVIQCDTFVNIEEESNSSITISPNPNYGIIKISSSEVYSRVEVYNISGKNIIRQLNNETDFILNINDNPPGIYVIKLQNDFSQYISKIILIN